MRGNLEHRVQQVDGSINFQPLHSRSTASRSLRLHPSGTSASSSMLNKVMRTHIQRTVSGCFAALRQLRQIRNSVPTATFQSLVVALVLSRLDYGHSVLISLPITLVRRLQSVQNATTRLICRLQRFDRVTDACAGQLALAARPGTRRLQDSHANVQGSA